MIAGDAVDLTGNEHFIVWAHQHTTTDDTPTHAVVALAPTNADGAHSTFGGTSPHNAMRLALE